MSGDGRVVVYRDQAGEYRWTDVAGNGEPVANSGEGHPGRDHANERALIQAHGRPVYFRDVNGNETMIHAPAPTPRPDDARSLAGQLEEIATDGLTEHVAIGNDRNHEDRGDEDVLRTAAHLLRLYAATT